MATPEQIQELVTRIQAMEAGELESGRRKQTLQGQVQNLTTQLTVSQRAGGATPGGGTSASGVGA
eukprot:1490444-Amphidinium_carterae.1